MVGLGPLAVRRVEPAQQPRTVQGERPHIHRRRAPLGLGPVVLNTDGYGLLAGDITADCAQQLASLSRLQADHALTIHQIERDAERIHELEATVALQVEEIERLRVILGDALEGGPTE